MGACNSGHAGEKGQQEAHCTEKRHSVYGGNKPIFFEHATWTEQGQSRVVTQRRANQDRVCAHLNFTNQSDRALFGVFDGHGQEGEHLAEFVMQRLPLEIERELKHAKNRPMEEIAKAAFANCAKALKEKYPIASRSGTTATVVLVDGTDLWTFNVGDSRAVLAQRVDDEFCAFPLSRDHSADDPEERRRVQAMGARVEETRLPHLGPIGCYRVVMGPVALAMTRAFGDFGCGACIQPEPEVRHHSLVEGRDLVLILASDGVWTFMENRAVVERALEAATAKEACENICQQAVLLWEQDGRVDDISLCTVFFNGHVPLPKTAKSSIHPLQLLDERRKVVFDNKKADEFRALVAQLKTARETTTDAYKLSLYNAKWPEIMELLDAFDEQLAQSEPRPPLDACQEKLLPARERALRIPLSLENHGVYGVLECFIRCDSNRKLVLTSRVAIVSTAAPGEDIQEENIRFEIFTGTLRDSCQIIRRVERAISKGQLRVNYGTVPTLGSFHYRPSHQHKASRKQCEMNLDESLLYSTNSIQVRLESDDRKEELIIPLVQDEEANNLTAVVSSSSGPNEALAQPQIQPESHAQENAEKPLASGERGNDVPLPPELVALLPATYKRNLSITELDNLDD